MGTNHLQSNPFLLLLAQQLALAKTMEEKKQIIVQIKELLGGHTKADS